MSDHDQAVNQIDQLEKRLASLHDLGVDTAALRSQLAFARAQVQDGRIAEALGICEEVADTARKLADGSAAPAERPRTGRFTRDQLTEAVKDLLSQGLLAKLMAEQRSGPDVRLEARLNDLDERLRGYIGHEADALRAEQQVLREEIELVRRSVGTAVATPFAEPATNETAQTGKEPLWAARLHSILVKAIRRTDAQAAQIASIVQQFATQGGAAASSGLTARVEALRSSIADDLRSVAERVPSAVPVSEPAAEPAWAQQLAASLNAVAERMQTMSVPAASPADDAVEPAWAQQLAMTLQSVAERLSAPVASVAATPVEAGEPAWAQALRDTLDAMTTRLGAQPMTLVAEPPAVEEPAWSVTLRDALGAAEARHQEVLATLAVRQAAAGDPALGEQLAGAFERGLHDLGALLAQQRPGLAPPIPMDDSRSALSPVTVSHDAETREAAHSSTRTERTVVDAELVRSLVQRELEAAIGTRGTMAVAKREGTEHIRALVAAELDVRQGGAIERTDRTDVSDLRATLLRLLPDLLGDEAVRRSLFAVLALEAVSKPGALGELTGLRTFLKRELGHAAEELATKLQPA